MPPQPRALVFLPLLALFACEQSALEPMDPAGGIACQALKPLADRQVLVPEKTHYAYYTPDRSFLLLQTRGNPDRLIRVDLPSGDTRTVIDALTLVEPLGTSGSFLLLGTGDDASEVEVYDGTQVRPLFSGSCPWRSTPDGTRLYLDGSCVGEADSLAVIDVATGTSKIVAHHAVMGPLAITPNGQWIAYQTGDSYSNHNRTLVVVDVAGNAYTIALAQDVSLVEFADNDLLVFQTTDPADFPGDIRGHHPGSGDTSFLIAAKRDPGFGFPCYSHQFSPDRTRVLAVQGPAPYSIYSIPLRGGDPQLLVEDWHGPSSVEQPFAFDAQSKYAVFQSQGEGEPPLYPLSVVDLQGSKPKELSPDAWFAMTPSTSSVLIVESDNGRQTSRLRLTDLPTGRDRLTYASNADLAYPTVLRGDQAVLFAELDGDTRRVRFLSAKHPQSVLLGEWNDSTCRGCSPMPVQADPTACFTVVNTDKAGNPGTRLVLLPE